MIGDKINCAICGKEFVQEKHEPAGLHCSDRCLNMGWYKLQTREHTKRLVDEGRLPHSFINEMRPTKNNQDMGVMYANESHGACCYIHGLTGTGKSGLAQIIMQDYLSRKESAAFDSATNLFGISRKYEIYVGARILCIDDLHVHKWGEFSTSLLHDCLTQREQRRLRTIVTCEWDIVTFAEHLIKSTGGMFGHSTLARLDCCGRRVDIEMIGENLRRVNPGA